MDEGYEKEKFETFKLKASVAMKFRKFCKKFSKSQSMTLLSMMDFFEINEVSPNERLGETFSSLKHQIQKRFNAVIAIIRDIEKSQIKPTTAMLQQLFEQASTDVEEKEFDFGTPELISENEELIYYRENYFKIQEQFNTTHNHFEELMDKIKYVKGSLGSNYFKLEITREEYGNLKQKLNNVRNYNSTTNR
ncbi:BfmA/BtgA family mobilization protein [uncultured Tenacibaculum sp.]|uniref:BfmA/BtgA family mobilization protein n=1 Tax=uncultured Tenacibaculum sp. TaxID=174713 RepID=UPI002614043B|nr:BfmA/BtgA family mobilization protein [uncultured Tenacibaculum sp.]